MSTRRQRAEIERIINAREEREKAREDKPKKKKTTKKEKKVEE